MRVYQGVDLVDSSLLLQVSLHGHNSAGSQNIKDIESVASSSTYYERWLATDFMKDDIWTAEKDMKAWSSKLYTQLSSYEIAV